MGKCHNCKYGKVAQNKDACRYDMSESGKVLYTLIKESEPSLSSAVAIYEQIFACLEEVKLHLSKEELEKTGYNVENMIEQFRMACPDVSKAELYDVYEELSVVDEALSIFYDFCDAGGIWLGGCIS